MSKPILTFTVADNGEVYVYTGVPHVDGGDVYGGECLEAVLDPNREDFEFQVQEYALHGVREALESRKPH